MAPDIATRLAATAAMATTQTTTSRRCEVLRGVGTVYVPECVE
jgi:hypothetical protein